MAQIDLKNIAHSYAAAPSSEEDFALKKLDVSWKDGGAYALLGPSGCGKTTLLNIISGLLHPTQGAVLFNGADITSKPPEARNIAQVFQFPVIYDTMTVYQNLAFPLHNRKVPKREIDVRVRRCWNYPNICHAKRAIYPQMKNKKYHLAAALSARMSPRCYLMNRLQ